MTSSDRQIVANKDWSADPLLSGRRAQEPTFVRSRWDAAASSPFGPWRIAPATDPTEGLTSPLVLPLQAPSGVGATPASVDDVILATEHEPLVELEIPRLFSISEQEFERARSEAYAQGLAAGIGQERIHVQADRDRESELIRHLGIELRALNQDTQRFFEPLRKLSLHVAEQLVRAELQISGEFITTLIKQAIEQLEQPGAKVIVSLNPADAQRLANMGAIDENLLQIETDTSLREGSVRARVNDSMVQDLIEHRLEPIVRRLLAEPDAWLHRS